MEFRSALGKVFWMFGLMIVLYGCDQLEDATSSGGGSKAQAAVPESNDGIENADAAGDENNFSQSDSGTIGQNESEEKPQNSEPIEVAQNTNSTVRLDAFKNFKCTSNWKNRDGGLGLKVGSRSGTCTAAFPGGAGLYRVELLAQTEREGQSPYRISINGQLAGAGKFPFSQGQVNCKCHKQPWQLYCPDVVVNLDSGTHYLNPGDVIEYYGEEEYLCGKHGAYSKWRGMVFTPVN